MEDYKNIPISDNWSHHVRKALVHVASLAHWSIIHTRSWAADSKLQRVRLTGELDRTRNELSLVREQMRIKDMAFLLLLNK